MTRIGFAYNQKPDGSVGLVTAAQSEAARPGLVARHPRQTHLRIGRELRLAPERAVVVHAHGPREKESVVERQLLLDVAA